MRGSHLGLYLIAAAAIALAVLAAWYFTAPAATAPSEGTPVSAVESTNMPPVSSGDSVSDIQADLNQTPNDSAAMVQDQQSLDQSIQGI